MGGGTDQTLELDRIHEMDCLDGIKLIPTASVKIIASDPPYFMGMTHNGQRGSFVDLAICKPFFKELYRECKRILRPDGEVYWFTDWRGYAFYYPIFDAMLGCRNLIVWDKCSGPGNFYAFQHEFIMFATMDNTAKKKGTNIWRSPGFSAGAKQTNGEKVHETQKTIEIMTKIIQPNSAPGDLIVDLFAGSGTTLEVCKKLDRRFCGFELDEENIEIAYTRSRRPVQDTFFK